MRHLPARSPRYFTRFGRTSVLLGFALIAAAAIGLATNGIPALAVLLPLPLLSTGAAMWLVPGDSIHHTFEPAWMATRAGIKLVWLLAFAIGALAMMATMFFYVAPTMSPSG